MTVYDLDPSDIRRIAADAGVVDKTVERFLRGEPGHVRKDRKIISAMKLLGFGHLVPEQSGELRRAG